MLVAPGMSASPPRRDDSGIGCVEIVLLPGCLTATLSSSHCTTPVAIALSMIVLITSEMPRFTLRYAAMPAQMPPATIATTRVSSTLSGPGNHAWPAKRAPAKAAMRYCPSTPMLKRFIRKPTATATAER